jgi:hypothetical protein
MADKKKAVYAPGELSRVRDKLRVRDDNEARQMAERLGGEVGYERSEDEEKARQNPGGVGNAGRGRAAGGKSGGSRGRAGRMMELPPEAEGGGGGKQKSSRRKETDPADDPSVPVRASYWERVKMDKIAGQPEFEIKSPGQVFYSMISLSSNVADYVSPVFVTRRLPEYYKRLETLVVSTRTMFPRNNMRRNERMKKGAPLAYSILDVIRYWDIERISGDLARLQAHPRDVKLSDLADILRAFYRPLFILDRLETDAHIRGTYKVLYKALYLENPSNAQGNKYQELIRTALAAFTGIRRDIHYLLYPLLMKTISAKYVPYEIFFLERRNRFMAFLNMSEDNQINPAAFVTQENAKDSSGVEQADKPPDSSEGEAPPGQAPKEELSEEEKSRRLAEESEKRAFDRGVQALEMLFPKAGWEGLASYPDFYPYFVGVFDLKKGIVNIAPTDPIHQIYILMRILEELLFGLRYVSFGTIPDSSGGFESVDAKLGEIINNWHFYIQAVFEREYLPRMTEYVRILEGSYEERSSTYTKKLVSELHWLKRLYLLPFYKFDSLMPHPFQKRDVIPIYSKIGILRKYLATVAMGIEQGNKAGGAEAHASCDGIDNPWEPYMFQVPNPLSRRLDALIPPKTRNNASLIYFCLAVTVALDRLVNSEDSWAYSNRPGPLFRSVNGEGVTPLTGVDERINADGLFKLSLKNRQKSN